MIASQELERIKQIAITDYLLSKGHKPVKTVGKELVYYSPCHEENTPSFLVDPIRNVFHDFSGEGEKGDVIRLLQYLHGCSFVEAIQTLRKFTNSKKTVPFSFSGLKPDQAAKGNVDLINILPLRSRALLRYLSSRSISYEVASRYLQEVHYIVANKQYYALGFQNDKGGFELRSLYFKGATSPKWFTTLPGQQTGVINLFEGVFDFLSCCQHHDTNRLNNLTIILNSLSLLQETLPALSQYQSVNTFFDNDIAGRKALVKLKQHNLLVSDCSYLYASYKDYNAYYMQK
ncbi:Toprim domain-containing protein [Larkinella arboricola]|uniref:Toprim domain-containing protein n=1 Tax=Larkinella arboricola TaxID=643671 RepID=A0A327WW93_LARAB|nr:toprim domain-containing protein [Larkinella arboricola]RAJ97587.1 Toprim domain-containing protein [Larkinella arboricola]